MENYSHLQSFNREYQLPQAYQYFENVRNFLVALEQLRLPGFEASDLEKVTHLENFFLMVLICYKLSSNRNVRCKCHRII